MIALWLETEQNKFASCREPYIAPPSWKSKAVKFYSLHDKVWRTA